MHRTLLYNLALGPLRFALRVYFRQVEVIGRDNIPPGPVVLAANHPQSITDALVLAGSMDRVVHYLAHSGLFKNGLQSWVLRAFGVIPIARRGEASERPDENVLAFAACFAHLDQGKLIAIFPEGVSTRERRVQPLRTGAARITLEAAAQHDFRREVALVPVGLSFQSQARFRSRVLVRVGKPLSAVQRAEAYRADPRDTVTQLTQELEAALRALVVNVDGHGLEKLVTQVEEIYREAVLENPRLAVPGRSRFQQETAISQEIAQAARYFREADPEALWSLRQTLGTYQRERERWRVDDRMIRGGEVPPIRRRAVRLLALYTVGLPFVVVGGLVNALPYGLTTLVVRAMAPDETKRHYLQLTFGSLICLAYYPTLLFLMRRQWDLTDSQLGLAAVSLIPLGLVARLVVVHWRRERRMLRFAFLGSTHRAALRNLRRLRYNAISEIEAMLKRYLKIRESRAGG